MTQENKGYMGRWRIMPLVCLALAAAGGTPLNPVTAQEMLPAGSRPITSTFAVPPGLRGRVDFWKLIFAKYGENQMLVHHREHPEIIYSALDFSDYAEQYAGKALAQLKDRAVSQETARVQAALRKLAAGRAPENPFELRIQRLFSDLGMAGQRHYLHAAEPDIVRTQTGIKERFADALRRSGRYLYAMEHIFAEEGLPIELARLPFVESSFNYSAYSAVGAAGIWQFMRGTGKNYMRIDSYIDERRDPIISTRAAAKYLAHAYRRIGSWPLAITSYNHGITGVLRAAKAMGTTDITTIVKRHQSESFGFASSNFYVEFLAALEINMSYKTHFPEVTKEDPWHFDEVKLSRSLPFADLVRISGADRETIERLNPAILSPVSSGRAPLPPGFLVKVPRGAGTTVAKALGGSEVLSLSDANDHFEEAVKEAKDRSKAKSYIVQPKDTASSIGKRFGVSSDELLRANGLRQAKALRAGMRLTIPARTPSVGGTVVTVKSSGSASSTAPRLEPAVKRGEAKDSRESYKIQAGDSLGSIAHKFGVSSASIAELNDIKDAKRLKVGKTLLIPSGGKKPAVNPEKSPLGEAAAKPTGTKPAEDQPKTGAVPEGNGAAEDRSKPEAEAAVTEPAKEPVQHGKTHKIQHGDTLYGIARKHGLTVNQLKAVNPDATDRLKLGQTLRLE